MAPLRGFLYHFAPPLLFLAFYWSGLTIYFHQDDFGWLNLRNEVEGWSDLLPALFSPKAHGNLRPWSENGFFLLFSTLFGAHPLPFRVWVFLTQFANLLLLGAVVRRLTGDHVCALATQFLWIFNACLAPAACWTSIYNQIQSTCFLLGAFYLFLRGRYVAQWIVFILGFGSLEVNVVYPALVALYAWLFARPLLAKTIPMFVASGIYAVLHFAVAPHAAEGVYMLHFDWRMLPTLWTYWTLALGVDQLSRFVPLPRLAITSAIAALTTAAAAFVAWRTCRRDWLPLFAIGWFVILLAPLLPLHEHISEYYLTGPVIGLALLAAWAFRCAILPASLAIALFLAISIPAAWHTAQWHHDRAERVRDLVMGVERARTLDPGKVILLTGIDRDLYDGSVANAAFLALRIPQVYLAPGFASNFALPEGLAGRLLAEDRAVVYDASGSPLRNVTSSFAGHWMPGPPRAVNPGDPIFDSQLGGDWRPARNGYRYMRSNASVRIAAPSRPDEKLEIGVFCDIAPRRLLVEIQELRIAETLARCDTIHVFSVTLPTGLSGEFEVTLHADRPGGISFGYLEIR